MYNFNERLKKLFIVDKIRIFKFIEMIQYSFIFLILICFFSFIINRRLFIKNKTDKNKTDKIKNSYTDLIITFFHILFYIIIITLVFFYSRKIALLFPSIPNIIDKKFIPYTTLEYTVHIALVVTFIELLPEFKNRIVILKEKFSEILYTKKA